MATQITADKMLKRELGLSPAIMMGLGSILGTGIFVSIGIAAGIAGPSVILAILLAALVATCNALSSAQLAAAHPVSGGTYEYGHRFLHPSAGFLAGWMFLLAKSASAATAALGFAGYLLTSIGTPGLPAKWVAFVTVVLFTLVVLSGIRRSIHVNNTVVSITLATLLGFVAAGVWFWFSQGPRPHLTPFFQGETPKAMMGNLFHATAIMFVAYTGYGRIATLAEEVTNPRRTIPRAIIATLAVSGALYLAVALAGIGSVGSHFLSESTQGNAAPLELAAREFGYPILPYLIAAGAATAMLGVLLNLILGLSRVVLAMARHGDMPRVLSRLNREETAPIAAIVLVGILVAGLTLIGSVKTTWTFSAFTVLIYYAVTNASALAIPAELRLFPRWICITGLVACLFLAFWVEWQVWAAGLGLAGAGLVWQFVMRKVTQPTGAPKT